ncbi:MAG: hypothetical protein JST76_05345 [Bacteroidetes bacterium]|nr:hypothetical protein [Bacteroidota bacterium]
MKNISFLIFIVLMIPVCRAQSFVLSFGGGGDAPIARTYTTSYQSQVYSPTATYVTRVAPVSLGQGGNLFVALDWYSIKDIGAGLKINGFFGAPFKIYSEELNNGGVVIYNIAQQGFSGQFIPHFSFRHDFKKVTPVAEIGMMIGLSGIKETINGNYNSGASTMSSVIWEKGDVSLGFYSSLGIQIKLSRHVSLSLAAVCIAASYSPTHWERTSYTINGTDQLSQLQVSDRYGNYVKEINSGTTQSPTSPRVSLRYSAPFSNVGLNVGFAFLLAKHKSGASEKKNSQDVHSF